MKISRADLRKAADKLIHTVNVCLLIRTMDMRTGAILNLSDKNFASNSDSPEEIILKLKRIATSNNTVAGLSFKVKINIKCHLFSV